MKLYRLTYVSLDDMAHHKWFSSNTTARAYKKIAKAQGFKPGDVEAFDTGKGVASMLEFMNNLEEGMVTLALDIED